MLLICGYIFLFEAFNGIIKKSLTSGRHGIHTEFARGESAIFIGIIIFFLSMYIFVYFFSNFIKFIKDKKVNRFLCISFYAFTIIISAFFLTFHLFNNLLKNESDLVLILFLSTILVYLFIIYKIKKAIK